MRRGLIKIIHIQSLVHDRLMRFSKASKTLDDSTSQYVNLKKKSNVSYHKEILVN